MYFCNMETKSSIIQLSFSIDNADFSRYLVLAEVTNEKVIGIYLVKLPEWLKFYSETYKYYCINFN